MAAQARSEWVDRMQNCLEDDGYQADRDGPYGLGIKGVDQATADAAWSACQHQVGPVPSEPPPSPEELSRLYDANLATMACLEALGIAVPDPPTREAYIDSYLASYTTGVGPWGAYAGPEPIGKEAQAACPQPLLENLDQP